MGIGSKLSRLMEENGTNANELANKVDVPAQTIYSIIKRDSKKADIEVLFRIANIFGVKPEYFVSDEEPRTIAAHFDGSEYTEEELDKIKEFAEFVKGSRK
jgi:Predicted transcriptional regulators